ncbi:hypothetical protein QBC32DRAFT_263341 [Pseudoneurospora amorphoporcata]|uniref:Uncharacterized protein n=1 Tax=Pseudoneurospora amorphoporcata TaxID=241081 RepID=A0AAN6SE85_9PEZI|nr:hypothetical protein QBC32DRAFT_263341 [Pseudoneurospora amorphoporcata]
MAPATNLKTNPKDNKPKGRKPTNPRMKYYSSPEEQAALKEFHDCYAEFSKLDNNNKVRSQLMDVPKAKVENPLPPGTKGLAASRWAIPQHQPAADDTSKPAVEIPLPPVSKGLATSRWATAPKSEEKKAVNGNSNMKKNRRLRETAEERKVIEEFRVFYAEADNESGKSFFQSADHDTPRAKMENPLPPGAKGLASSRWATAPKKHAKSMFVARHFHLSTKSTPRFYISYANKGKGKATQRKKYNATLEEDAAVKAFFAESPKSKEKKVQEQSYQAADHDTTRAKMENPLPAENLGLAGWRSLAGVSSRRT